MDGLVFYSYSIGQLQKHFTQYTKEVLLWNNSLRCLQYSSFTSTLFLHSVKKAHVHLGPLPVLSTNNRRQMWRIYMYLANHNSDSLMCLGWAIALPGAYLNCLRFFAASYTACYLSGTGIGRKQLVEINGCASSGSSSRDTVEQCRNSDRN